MKERFAEGTRSANIGCDPEFFIFDKDGKTVPAHRLFPSKHEKRIIGQGHGVLKAFRDGYAVEVNTGATHCRAFLLEDLRIALKSLQEIVRPKGYTIRAISTVPINLADTMKDAPADCLEFGCDPSFDAYKLTAKLPTIDAKTHPWRYAGGHMHFSIPTSTPDASRSYSNTIVSNPHSVLNRPDEYPMLAKLFDLYIGLPLSSIFHRPEQYARRRYYGQAGEFRPQTYPGAIGFEYRTPGPEMWNHHAIAGLAFGVGKLICVPENYARLKKAWDKTIEDDLQCAINTGYRRYKLMKEVPGFYNDDVIRKLWRKGFWDLQIVNSQGDLHSGWSESAAAWNIVLP